MSETTYTGIAVGFALGMGVSVIVDLVSLFVIRRNPRLRQLLRDLI